MVLVCIAGGSEGRDGSHCTCTTPARRCRAYAVLHPNFSINCLTQKSGCMMLLLLAVGAVVGSAGAADSGLTLAVYNNTGFGGDAFSTKVIPSFDFTHPG